MDASSGNVKAYDTTVAASVAFDTVSTVVEMIAAAPESAAARASCTSVQKFGAVGTPGLVSSRSPGSGGGGGDSAHLLLGRQWVPTQARAGTVRTARFHPAPDEARHTPLSG